MTPDEIGQLLKQRFGDQIIEVNTPSTIPAPPAAEEGEGAKKPAKKAADPRETACVLHPHVAVAAAAWPEIARYLKDEPELAFDMLRCLTGLDYPDRAQMCACYDLHSFRHNHQFAVKAYTQRDDPHIPSVASLWPAADWHEREAYDLFGIIFDGHPDLRRILLADDWVGFPLRKDYEFPREYHGIPGSVELDWQQHPGYEKKKK
jgi:NADH-quinone oxidoreductase subunit C